MRKFFTVFFLFVCFSGYVVGDCDSVLEILDIGDREAGDTVIIVVRTNETNVNQTRSLDVFLLDPVSKIMDTVKTQFDSSHQDTSIELKIPTDNNFVNGSYKIKAQMDVYKSYNTSQHVCGSITYSNKFKIKTDRQHYSHSPFIFKVDEYLPLDDFKFSERKCEGGRCIELNVSGKMPRNFSIIPALIWSESNISKISNITFNISKCYESNVVEALYYNFTVQGERLNECLDKFFDASSTVDAGVGRERSLQSRVDVLESEISRLKDTHQLYKDEYHFGASWLVLFFLLGAVAIIVYAYFYSKKVSEDSPHEDT